MNPPPVCPPRRLLVACCLGMAGAQAAHAADDLTMFSLEQLLDVTVTGASKYAQKQSEVPAAVSVVTRQEIPRLRLAHAGRGPGQPAWCPHDL